MKPYPLQLEISGPIAPCLRRVRRGRLVWARPDRSRRSADLQSAVSRICNPQRSRRFEAAGLSDNLPNAIRRYSRLKICATAKRNAYVDAFHRRLERGRWFYTPCLHSTVPLAHRMGEGSGVRATPDYVELFRFKDGTTGFETEGKDFLHPKVESQNPVIPAFLEMVFDQQQSICANGPSHERHSNPRSP